MENEILNKLFELGYRIKIENNKNGIEFSLIPFTSGLFDKFDVGVRWLANMASLHKNSNFAKWWKEQQGKNNDN